jgi:hypothetical protein
VCVAKEPTRVIIYRGREPGIDPPWIKKDPKTGEVLMPRRPLIAQALQETDSSESTGDFEEIRTPLGRTCLARRTTSPGGRMRIEGVTRKEARSLRREGRRMVRLRATSFDDDVILGWGEGSEDDSVQTIQV